MIQAMNEFLTNSAAAVGNTNTVGPRQADVEERKLERDWAQSIPKLYGDGIGTWKWKVKKCAGTRFENLGRCRCGLVTKRRSLTMTP